MSAIVAQTKLRKGSNQPVSSALYAVLQQLPQAAEQGLTRVFFSGDLLGTLQNRRALHQSSKAGGR
jgi:hypothetical protein